MTAAWDQFHASKHIFKDLNVREHFNIPKIHLAIHYTLSIRKLGTTDGYNTEQSERLHINYAKQGYAASNKRAYIKQMAIWLNRQEAVTRFHAYLDWAEPSVSAIIHPSHNGGEPSNMEHVCESDGEDVRMQEVSPGSREHDSHGSTSPPHKSSSSLLPYVVAKTLGLPGTSVRQLVSQFGCTHFVRSLEDFLHKASHSQALPLAARTIFPCSRFAIYKRCHVFLPPLCQVSQEPVKDTIRAVPAQPAQLLQPASHSRFNTVLVCEAAEEGDPDPNNPLSGLTVVRVRAIFQLPEIYGTQFKHPVAYVEWFTPFWQPDP